LFFEAQSAIVKKLGRLELGITEPLVVGQATGACQGMSTQTVHAAVHAAACMLLKSSFGYSVESHFISATNAAVITVIAWPVRYQDEVNPRRSASASRKRKPALVSTDTDTDASADAKPEPEPKAKPKAKKTKKAEPPPPPYTEKWGRI
jgi:hypothetical protein